VEAIEPVMALDYPKNDGTTRRQHLVQLKWWDVIDNETPDIPESFCYLWEWFWQVIGGKGDDGWWTAVQAWSTMTGTEPTIWEARVMGRLHDAYQKAVSKRMKS
jgi:hypothetical protein